MALWTGALARERYLKRVSVQRECVCNTRQRLDAARFDDLRSAPGRCLASDLRADLMSSKETQDMGLRNDLQTHTRELNPGAGANREARDANGDSPLTWASRHHRPSHILAKLCFGPHRIHPLAVESAAENRAAGWRGMEKHLAGKPHFSPLEHQPLHRRQRLR